MALQFAFLRPWLGTLSLWLPLYFVIFLLFWKWLDKRDALVTALPVTLAVLFLIPALWSWQINAAAPQYRLSTVDLAEPIAVSGNIRLDTGSGRQADENGEIDPMECDIDCLALLFTRGVTSVTVNSTRGASFEDIRDGTIAIGSAARSFSFKPVGECADGGHSPIVDWASASFNWTKRETEAAAEWQARSGDDLCLEVGEPLQSYDFLLRNGVWGTPEAPVFGFEMQNPFIFLHDCSPPIPPKDWIGFSYSELRTGDGVLLFRNQNLRTNVLDSPLALNTPRCSAFPSRPIGFEMDWREGTADPVKEGDETLSAVFRRLAWRSQDSDAELLGLLRSFLSDALADGTVADNPGTGAVRSAYFRLLNLSDPTDTDVEIVTSLIRDPGLWDLPEAEDLGRIFDSGAMRAVRAAIADKLLTAERRNEGDFRDLSRAIASVPKGQFTELLPAEVTLLRRDSGDPLIRSLIRKLPELGAEVAPLLAELAMSYIADEIAAGPAWREEDHAARREKRARLDNAKSAVNGLCVLGEEASGELTTLRDFGATIEWNGGYPLHREWQRMLLSIGEDRGGITKGRSGWSGDDDSFREALERQIANGCQL